MKPGAGGNRLRVAAAFAAGLAAAMAAAAAAAGMRIDVDIGPPAVVAVPAEVVMVPRSGVYYVPDPEIDLLFHEGYRYSPRGDRWDRARAYDGPWVVMERRLVPAQVIRVPRDYRVVHEDEDDD